MYNYALENEALQFVACHVTLQQTILAQITVISEQYIASNADTITSNIYKNTESPHLQSTSLHPELNHVSSNREAESCTRYDKFNTSLTPLFTLPSPSPGHPPLPHCNLSEDCITTINGYNSDTMHNANNTMKREKARVTDVYACEGNSNNVLVYPTSDQMCMSDYSGKLDTLSDNYRNDTVHTNSTMENIAKINTKNDGKLTVNLSLILDAFEVLDYSPVLGEVLIREPSPLFESVMNVGISRWLQQLTKSFEHNKSSINKETNANEEIVNYSKCEKRVIDRNVHRANIGSIIKSWPVHLQQCVANGKFIVFSRLLILRIPHFLSMWSSVQDITNVRNNNSKTNSNAPTLGVADQKTEVDMSGNVRYNVHLIRHDKHSRWQSHHTEVFDEASSLQKYDNSLTDKEHAHSMWEGSDSNNNIVYSTRCETTQAAKKLKNKRSSVCSLHDLFHDISDIPLPEETQQDWQEQTSNVNYINEESEQMEEHEQEKHQLPTLTASSVELEQKPTSMVHDAVMCSYPETCFFHSNAHVCLRGVICEIYFSSRESVLPLPVALMHIWPSFTHTHGNTTTFIDVHLIQPHVLSSSMYIGSTIEIRGQCIVPDYNVHGPTLQEVAKDGPPEVQAVITSEYIEVHSLLCIGTCESEWLQTFLNSSVLVNSPPLSSTEQTHNLQGRNNCQDEYIYDNELEKRKTDNSINSCSNRENAMSNSQSEMFALRLSPPKPYSCLEKENEEEQNEHSYTSLQHHNFKENYSDSSTLHHSNMLPNGVVSSFAEELAAQWSVRSWECSRLAMGIAPSFGTTTPLEFVCTNVFVCSLDAIIASLVSLFGGIMHRDECNNSCTAITTNRANSSSDNASMETSNKGEVGVSFLLIDEHNDSILSNILDRVRDVCLECFVERTPLEVAQEKSYALLPCYEILNKPQQHKLLTEVLNHIDYRTNTNECKENEEESAAHNLREHKANATSPTHVVTEVIKGGLLNISSHRTLILPRAELLNAESLQKLWHALEVATYTSHHTLQNNKGGTSGSKSYSEAIAATSVLNNGYGNNNNINNNTLDECVVCRQGGFKEHYALVHSCICTIFDTPQLLRKACLLEFAQRVDIVIRPYLEERRNILAFYGLRFIKWKALLRERGSWWMSLLGSALHTPSLHDVFVARSTQSNKTNKSQNSSHTKHNVENTNGEDKTSITSSINYDDVNVSARALNVHFATPRLTEKCAELLQCYFVATKAISRELIDLNLMSTLIRLTIAHASYRVKLMYTAFFDQAVLTRNLQHENMNHQVKSNNTSNKYSVSFISDNVSLDEDKGKRDRTTPCHDTQYGVQKSNETSINKLSSALDELIPVTHCTPAPTTLIDALVAIGLCDSTLHFLTGKTFLGQCIFALLEREMQNACAEELCQTQDIIKNEEDAATDTNTNGRNTCAGNASVEDAAANELEQLYKYLEKVTRPQEMCCNSLPSAAPCWNFTLLRSFVITDIVNELRSHLYDGINSGAGNS